MPIIQRLGSASARGFGFGKTGVTYQRTVQESSTITDSPSRAVSYDSAISETSTAADAIASLLNSLNQILETATGSDSIQGDRGYLSAINETATISDLISSIGNQNVTASETSTATDAVSNIGEFSRTVTETASITDAPQGSRLTTNNIAETGTASDVITSGRTTSSVISEVALGYDDIDRLALANGIINETATGADSVSLSVSPSYWMTVFYGTTTSEYQYGGTICKDADQNIYVAGYGAGNGAINAVNVIKYDKDGVLQWQRKLDGGTQTDVGYAIATDSSGNVFVAGGYNNDGNAAPPGGVRAFIVKLNSSGTVQWQNLFWVAQTSPIQQSNLSTRIYGMVLDSSGNIYTTGYTNFSTNLLFVAKHNSSGVLQWFTRISSGSSGNIGYSIKINSSGNLVIGGTYGYSGTNNYTSPAIYIFDTSGNLLSSVRMQDSSGAGGTRNSRFYSIALDASDNIYATGLIGTNSFGTGRDGPMLCKFDSSLNLLWTTELRTLNSSSFYDSPAYGVTVDSFGNPYISYRDTSFPSTSIYPIILVKFNTSGAIQWSNKISTVSGSTVYAGSNWLESSSTNLIAVWSDAASSNVYTGIAIVPLDGSRTGTYTVGPYGQPTTYASQSITQATLNWFTETPTWTQFSAVMTTATATFNNYTTTQSSTTVYI
jgi:Beta-propeller repeat